MREDELKDWLDAVHADTITTDPLTWPLEERPVVYVAGYYSANPMHGLAEATHAFDALVDLGWVPFVPHVSCLLDALSPRTPEFWYAYDLALLERCDALYVCDNTLTRASTGVQREVVHATECGIPVMTTLLPPQDVLDIVVEE